MKGPDLFGHLPGGVGEQFSLLGAACVCDCVHTCAVILSVLVGAGWALTPSMHLAEGEVPSPGLSLSGRTHLVSSVIVASKEQGHPCPMMELSGSPQQRQNVKRDLCSDVGQWNRWGPPQSRL